MCETPRLWGRAGRGLLWWATSSGSSSRACAHVPRAGEVVHASDPFEEPAGGGAVAAVQLARLAGAASLFTALGRDEQAGRSVARLKELGVRVHAVMLAAATRRAVTLLDDAGERTITTLGPRLDPLGRVG